MGLLDEAIREHLDLKRQHGANEDELARQEAEALGPVTQEDVSELDGAADSPGDGGDDGDAGWPFDRVAENELAGEPDEPSFTWSSREAEEVEVPPFVPAEPVSDTAERDDDAEPVDMPTQAFSAVDADAADREREALRESPSEEELGDEPPLSGDPETQLLRVDDAEEAEAEEPFEPEALEPDPLDPETDEPDQLEPDPLGLEPADPEPLEAEPPPVAPAADLYAPPPAEPAASDVEELQADAPELDELAESPAATGDADLHEPLEPPPVEVTPDLEEPLEPLPLELDRPAAELAEPDLLPGETEEPLSEPEPLEPYPLGGVEPEPVAETPADLAEPPDGLASPFEPALEEGAPLADAEVLGTPPPLEPPLPGEEPPLGPDPAAEQGSPPRGPPPIEEELDPGTQAWSVEAELEDVEPLEGQAGLEPLDPADDAFDTSPGPVADPEPLEAEFEPAPVPEEPVPEPPAAARGFFDDADDHDALWREDRPEPDPDFEN